MSTLDFVVMGAYFAVVLGIGAHFARKTTDASDYFLGRHGLPWWAVMLSVVATETSALTVISIPGIGARGRLHLPPSGVRIPARSNWGFCHGCSRATSEASRRRPTLGWSAVSDRKRGSSHLACS